MNDLNTFPDRIREAKVALKKALVNRDNAEKELDDARVTVHAAFKRLNALRAELMEAAGANDGEPAMWWQCQAQP